MTDRTRSRTPKPAAGAVTAASAVFTPPPNPPGGKSLTVIVLFALGLLSLLLVASLAVLFFQNGQYTAQQLFFLCALFAFVAAVAIFALFSVASLRAEIGGQIVVKGIPLNFQLAGAVAAFPAFYLLLWLLAPPPAIRTVYLTVAADKFTAPTYEVRYRRGKLGANLATGSLNTQLAITDVPASDKVLEVESVSALGLWLDKQAKQEPPPWKIAIDDNGYARIQLIQRDQWPPPLEPATVKKWLDEENIAKTLVMTAPKAPGLKESVSLKVVNATDRPLWVELFDCTRLFDTADAVSKDAAHSGRVFPLTKLMNPTNEALGFREPTNYRNWAPALDMFRDPTGWVAIYGVYQDYGTGDWHRSRIVVGNVFQFPRARLTITLAGALDRVFHGELTSDDEG